MLDDVSRDENALKEIQQHMRSALVLIGWIDAEPDYWKAQQNKIIVLNGSNRTFEKQEDDLKYIRHRKDGRYEFRRTINGQKFQYINRDRDLVKKFATNLNKKIKVLVLNGEPNSNVCFCDYAEEYFKLFKEAKASASSAAEWKTALKYFRENFDKPFKSYTPSDFQKALNTIAEEAPNTAKKTYNKICAICKKAFLSGIIKINIAEIIEKPEFEGGTRRALTLFEQVKFLNLLKKEEEDMQCFCLFCLITSARRQEAYRYKPQDFNRRNMTLFVNGTKTLNAPRTIKVTQSFAKVLEKIGKGFKHTADYYSRKAKDLFVKMGCPELVLNCLRHTCATNMVYFNIPAEYRKHIMGHSTIITTDRVYTHIDISVTKSRIKLIYKDLYFTDF